MNDYEIRRAARIERLSNRADKAMALSNAINKRATERAYAIPFGQPILIGHHSEGHDRHYRARIQRDLMRSAKLAKFATELERRAQGAESNHAISSDDPAAVGKVETRLDGLKTEHARMKAVNAAWRKSGTAGLVGFGFTSEQAERMAAQIETAHSWEKQPFPKWQMANAAANIRRLEQRIPKLEAIAATSEAEDEETMIGAVTMIRANADNRLRLRFPGKPDSSTIAALKRFGFRWSPTAGTWQRQLSAAAEYAARSVLEFASQTGATP